MKRARKENHTVSVKRLQRILILTAKALPIKRKFEKSGSYQSVNFCSLKVHVNEPNL